MINLGWLNYRGLYCQSIGNYHNPWRPNWMTANLLPILSVETHLVKAGISLKTFLAVKPSQIYGWLLTMTWRKSQITHWFSEQMEIIRIVHGPKLLWMIHDVTFVSPYYFVVCMLEPSESFFFLIEFMTVFLNGSARKAVFFGWRVDHEVPKLSESWHT